MKKITLTLILSFFTAIGISSLAQNTSPFQVTVTGKGKQAILFIPGYSCSGDVWKETIQQLGPNYTSHVFTFAGFAGIAPQANPSLNEWVQAIGHYIQTQKLNKPIVVGHSLGGVAAMWLASEYPDKIGKLVVVDALPCLTAIYNSNFQSQPTPDCSAFIQQFEKMDPQTFKTTQYTTMRSMVADTSKLETVVQWSIKSDKATLGKIYCDFSNTDMREKIAAITCPSLILLEAGFKAYQDTMNSQYKNLKTARIEYSTKGLHFIMYDDKDWYYNQLRTFLSQSNF
ncbi:alpha/beta hydrolase [Xanthocytophaga agilis]|uniref:Alpha/beta hydrolase n=1 Tax=Xanthocytophaga agilis TaxID=3048010 RepID=A0AAE3R3J0_9BACT|nr:alpha/beta hydrolase [Xanthocytophaga agilis]MDJ1503186.1 alpha/beta hydrolase [Xanthocytophaga agilis]